MRPMGKGKIYRLAFKIDMEPGLRWGKYFYHIPHDGRISGVRFCVWDWLKLIRPVMLSVENQTFPCQGIVKLWVENQKSGI